MMTIRKNLFPDNKLNLCIVTSGLSPATMGCILQVTMWPVTPTPFGDKAFTSLVQPYGSVSKHLEGTDFSWALDQHNPIYREADTLYNVWQRINEYLTNLYGYPKNIRVVNISSLFNIDVFSCLLNMYYRYCDMVSIDPYTDQHPWPFIHFSGWT